MGDSKFDYLKEVVENISRNHENIGCSHSKCRFRASSAQDVTLLKQLPVPRLMLLFKILVLYTLIKFNH